MTEIHLRDARHAHQFYTSNQHSFTPKTKFLYHVVFVLSSTSEIFASRTNNFGKEIGVLCKSADLPSFRATVETKQQYNRKKNIQTRLDYEPVTFRFHDDNAGVTRSLFEEYYRYYFVDGNYVDDMIAFDPLDKYAPLQKEYGLNNKIGTTTNGSKSPFFKEIRIYQLGLGLWNAYTLVNPIVQQWQHDNLDYSDGAGLMENVMNVMYEAVYYTNGTIGELDEPKGFTDPETRYDVTPSPAINKTNILDSILSRVLVSNSDITITPLDIGLFSNNASAQGGNNIVRDSNGNAIRDANGNPVRTTLFNILEQPNDPGGIPGYLMPVYGNRTASILSSELPNRIPSLTPSQILRTFQRNEQILDSAVRKALASGLYSGFNVNNFSVYDSLSDDQKTALRDDFTLRATGGNDKKAQQIASIVISYSREQIQ